MGRGKFSGKEKGWKQGILVPGVSLLLLVPMTLGVSQVLAQDCPVSVGLEDFGDLNQPPNDVAVAGNLAFTADTFGLTVYDVSDPSAPVKVGNLLSPGETLAVAVHGTLVYLADSRYGRVRIVDVSVPENPVEVHSFRALGVVDLAVSGPYLFVLSYSALTVYDLSNPENPVRLGTCGIQDSGRGFTVAGSLALVAAGHRGMVIIDVSDPVDPVVAAVFDTPFFANDVAVSGGIACVADDQAGIQVVDISDPTAPVGLGSFDTPGTAWGVALSGGTLLVADMEAGLQVLDVSNPATPVLLGSLATGGAARRVVLGGTTAWVADRAAGLYSVDVTDPMAPVLLGFMEAAGEALDLKIQGSVVFVANGVGGGLQSVDVSDPTAPVLLGRLVTPGEARGVDVEGGVACVADGRGGGLRVVDVSDPASPVEIGSVDTPGGARDVALRGTTAFVADGVEGLQVIDLSDPTAPAIIGSLSTTMEATGVEADGDRVYLAVEPGRLEIVDVSDTANPVLLGIFTTPDPIRDLAVAGDLVHLAADRQYLVVDVTDPTQPKVVDSEDVRASNVVLGGGNVYLGSGTTLRIRSIGGSLWDLFYLQRSILSLAIDPSTGTLWSAAGPLLEGTDVGCAACRTLQAVADPASIFTGGETATITVTLEDPFGAPLPGHTVSGFTDLGTLSAFADDGDGTYTATFTSGEVAGTALVSLSLDGVRCDTTVEVVVRCAAGPVDPPVNLLATPLNQTEISLAWDAEAEAVSYLVYRGTHKIAEVEPAVTSFKDEGLSPGTEYCYVVRAVDACGGEWATGPVCAVTAGEPRTCPVPTGRTGLSLQTGAGMERVALRGRMLHTVDGRGLGVWNLDDPADPRYIGHWTTEEPLRDVTLGPGEVVFVAAGDAGVFAVDTAGSDTPVAVGHHGGSLPALSVAYRAPLLLVGSEGEVLILDATDPTDLRELGRFGDGPERLWDEITRLAVSGNMAIAVEGGSRIVVFEISDPQNPRFWDSFSTWDFRDLDVEGTLLAVVDQRKGLLLYDISDPSDPVLLSSGFGRWSALSVDLSGDLAVLGGETFVQVLDVSVPFLPVPIAQPTPAGPVMGLVTDASLLVLAEGDTGFEVVDLTDAGSLVGAWATPGMVTDLAWEGSLAMVAHGEAGVAVVDVSDPSAPALLGTAPTPSAAKGVAMAAGVAYVAADEAGLLIFDLSDPAAPAVLGTVDTGTADGVAVGGGVAWVADQENGLVAVDVSDPVNPRIVGALGSVRPIRDLAVEGSWVYLALGGTSTAIVDGSDPANPVVVATVGEGGDGVVVAGDLAWLTVEDDRTGVIDISDPANPVLVGITYLRRVFDMAVSGTLAAVVARSGLYPPVSHLMLIDISDPLQLSLIWEVELPRMDAAVAFPGDELYAAAGPLFTVHTTRCRGPLAAFSWSMLSVGPYGLNVEFRDRTLNGADTWSWDFGDGFTSTEKNPFHLYAEPGIYTVTLTVTNGYGTDTVTRQVMVSEQVFEDVPVGSFGFHRINLLAWEGVTSGCSADPPLFCPSGVTLRNQMAKFLLRSSDGPAYLPPDPVGLFDDVPVTDPFAGWIEELAGRQITAGCSADPPLYCPTGEVTRSQMAKFLLRALEGPTYVPPDPVGLFDDVPVTDPFARWIEELAGRGITAGCSANPPRFCPGATVTRAQMAVFLGKAFGLGVR